MGNEDKIYDLLEKIYIELQDAKKEIKDFRGEAYKRFDNLEDKLNDLEAINADNHITIKSRLDKIFGDLDFLTHKEFQTEKEMYLLKQRLTNNKRSIK